MSVKQSLGIYPKIFSLHKLSSLLGIHLLSFIYELVYKMTVSVTQYGLQHRVIG
jgi:hypothetical protein